MQITSGNFYRVIIPSKRSLVAEHQEVEEALRLAIHDRVSLIILDCSRLEFLGSEGKALLISAHSAAHRLGLRMVLTCVDKRIETIFVITKLSLVFDLYHSVSEAIADHKHRATRV